FASSFSAESPGSLCKRLTLSIFLPPSVAEFQQLRCGGRVKARSAEGAAIAPFAWSPAAGQQK
ncbi:hypothetical protein, partial [Tatumella punctata]